MQYRIYIISVLAAFFAIGCGGAKKPIVKAPQKTKVSFEQIDFPKTISLADRSIYRAKLYLLQDNHPQRIELRDTLVKSIVTEFNTTDEKSIDKRRLLFEESLQVHAPMDFKPDRVSSAIEPMAKWIITHYERQGNEAIVLAALRFLMLACPDDTSHQEAYLELAGWSETVRKEVESNTERLTALVNVYLEMVRLVPDREIVERVAELITERYRSILNSRQSGEMSPYEVFRYGRELQLMPHELIYVFFLAGDPAGARKHLSEFVADGGVNVQFLEILDEIFQERDVAMAYFKISAYLEPLDVLSALKACIKARAADPTNPRYSLRIGALFEQMGHPECAADFYIEATNTAPSEEVFALAFELLRYSLLKVHYNENEKQANRMIKLADQLIERSLKQHPKSSSDLTTVAANLLYSIGTVQFDDGHIDDALLHFKRSDDLAGNIRALIKSNEVYFLRNDFNNALAVLNKALETDRDPPPDYWRATLMEARGDTLAAMGKTKQSAEAFAKALKLWGSDNIPSEQTSAAAIRRGIIMDKTGDTNGAMKVFRESIRLDPDGYSYTSLLSYLIQAQRLEAVKEFYKLAYNQDRIEPMWKIYFSLWTEALSVRQSKSSFTLAHDYLESSDGDSWQNQLAKYFVDKITLEQLRKSAKNVGQKVESDFYAALKALNKGEKAEARKLLDKVLASDYMGFFEYKMARSIILNEY